MTTSWKAKGHFVQAKADKYKHARHDCSQFCDATPSGLWLCRVTQNSMKTLTTVSGGSSGTTRCKIGMLHDQQLASCCGYHGNSLKKRGLCLLSAAWESPPSPRRPCESTCRRGAERIRLRIPQRAWHSKAFSEISMSWITSEKWLPLHCSVFKASICSDTNTDAPYNPFILTRSSLGLFRETVIYQGQIRDFDFLGVFWLIMWLLLSWQSGGASSAHLH